MIDTLIGQVRALLRGLDTAGGWLGLLGLRLVLAWEFFESGREKWLGTNWFDDIAGRFPFPFDLLPTAVSWQIATGFELVGGLALAIGLGTRFFAISLAVVTYVAIASVHWPEQWSTLAELAQGYVISDDGHGNFKLPLIYLAMLLPLILSGPGKCSLDALLARVFAPHRHRENPHLSNGMHQPG